MKQSLLFWRGVMVTAAVISLSAIYRVIQVMQSLDISISQKKWLFFIVFFIFMTILELFLFGMTWSRKVQHLIDTFAGYELKQPVFKISALILFIAFLGFYSWLIMASPIQGFLMGGPGGNIIGLGPQNGTLKVVDVINGVVGSTKPFTDKLINSGFQWWLFLICSLVSSFLLKISRSGLSITKSFLTAILGQAVIFKILSYLPTISSYPFSTVWSEGSRWYYASLHFSNKVYGYTLSPSFIDFPLDVLNSIPFIFGNLSVIIFRFWSVLLSLGITFATVLLLVRRLRIADRWLRGMFIAWCFLYLFQEGSIYPNLMLAITAILLGISGKKIWRSLIIIVLVSFWVGMDRVNWYPVPGMLAVALYLLEEPIRVNRNLLRYLVTPVLWLLCGMISALLGAYILMHISGTDLKATTSVFTSSLLWYRLLPNPTYRFGILPSILCISLPLWLIIVFSLRKFTWHILQLLGLGAIILVLFAGGLVVSTKIGGGSDLHNMDAYVILLLVISGYLYFQSSTPDAPSYAKSIPWPIVILAIAFPVFLNTYGVQLGVPYNHQAVEADLRNLNSYVNQASGKGDILFISQRQLITFGFVDTPLTSDYELVTLMEMVMSNNQLYLNQFHDNLRDHRFSLIVVEPQNMRIEGSNYQFGEENDVWVKQVSQPLLCYYKPLATLPVAGVQVFTPRQNPASCP